MRQAKINFLTQIIAIINISYSSGNKDHSVDSQPDFYEGCGTSTKICSGIGQVSNCISSRDCTIAGAVKKLKNKNNSTDFVIQLLSRSTKENIPCQLFGYVTNINYMRTLDENSLLNCLEDFKLEDFKFLFYVNSTGCNDNKTYNFPPWINDVSTTYFLNSTNKTKCEQNTRRLNPTKIKQYYNDHGILIQPFNGIMLTGDVCDFFEGNCMNSTDCIPWEEVYKDMKHYQGNFYSNINSVNLRTCSNEKKVAAFGSNGSWKNISFSVYLLIIQMMILFFVVIK